MSYKADNFSNQRARYFVPMIEALGLHESRGEEHEMFGFAEAAGSNILVRFAHDRGLCEFSVSSMSDPSRHWSAAIVATLFPRVRLMPGGEQRLSLAEQAQLLQTRWAELEQLFAPAQLSATLAKLQAEVARSLGRLGMKPANNSLEGDAAKPRASG
jgi:hypothetical protein